MQQAHLDNAVSAARDGAQAVGGQGAAEHGAVVAAQLAQQQAAAVPEAQHVVVAAPQGAKAGGTAAHYQAVDAVSVNNLLFALSTRLLLKPLTGRPRAQLQHGAALGGRSLATARAGRSGVPHLSACAMRSGVGRRAPERMRRPLASSHSAASRALTLWSRDPVTTLVPHGDQQHEKTALLCPTSAPSDAPAAVHTIWSRGGSASVRDST